MHGHPVQGIKGAKAKKLENGKSRSKNGPESGKPRLSSRPGARIAQLLEEYISLRNRAQLAEAAEILLAEKKGSLISKALAGFQAGYLLTVFRQRCLLKPTEIARKLVIRELLAPEKEHSSAEAIKQDIVALLHDLANLPGQISDPDWMAKIDPDFRAQVDVPPEPRTPGELKAEQAKAKRRRKAKIETMRKLRAKRP